MEIQKNLQKIKDTIGEYPELLKHPDIQKVIEEIKILSVEVSSFKKEPEVAGKQSDWVPKSKAWSVTTSDCVKRVENQKKTLVEMMQSLGSHHGLQEWRALCQSAEDTTSR